MPTANWIQRGYEIINRLATPMAAESVRYLRGTTEIASAMQAILTRPQFQLIDEGGAAVIGRNFQWEVKRDQLVWEGKEDRPRQNDVIEYVWKGKTYKFTIQPEVGATPEAGTIDVRSDWWSANATLVGIVDP